MFLESGSEIRKKIQKLIDETRDQPMRMAVAYWGKGTSLVFPRETLVICDLESGGCNPDAIRKLVGQSHIKVRTHADFHAKVVVGDTAAIVSSANISINGIGVEGGAASGTQEAGMLVPAGQGDYRAICEWFDERWNHAEHVTPEMLAKAGIRWSARAAALRAVGLPAIEPWFLLRQTFVKSHRLRRVREDVFEHASAALPGVAPTRVGKIATWACHLLLNRVREPLDYAATDIDPAGRATDDWIVGRFGKDLDGKTLLAVQSVLQAIRDGVQFDEAARQLAAETLRQQPWH